jgi:hypothetical protein
VADRSDSVNRLSPYGWITAIAGAADLIRIIPEVLGLPGTNTLYVVLVCGDLAAGIFAAIIGILLVRGHRWASGVATLVWGYLLANAAGMLWFIGWFFLIYHDRATLEDKELRILLPRLMFYALSGLAAPFLLGILVTKGAAPGARKGHAALLGSGLGLGAATAGLFVHLRGLH